MKSLCYLILAHNNLKYVAELIKLLACKHVGFILHIDSKCTEDISPLYEMEKAYNITLLENRYDVIWGDKSMVDSVNDMCRIGLRHSNKYDYFILLSGQDMPVKSGEYIKSYIMKRNAVNLIQSVPMLTDKCGWLENGRRRLECYAIRLGPRDIATIEPCKLNIGNLRQITKTFIRGNRSSIKQMFKAFFFKRRKGLGIKPYGGEFWWRLNRESLEKIIDYYDNNYELRKEIEVTSNPDEIIYNTLVNNLCSNNEQSLHTFINWENSNSPEWINIKDSILIEKLILDPDVLFCRKVKDLEVLNFVRCKIGK